MHPFDAQKFPQQLQEVLGLSGSALPPDHPLWKAPNVIITPHVANDSDLGYDAQIKVVQENLRRYVAGERMLSVVDVSKGY